MTVCVVCKKEPSRFTATYDTSDGQIVCEFCLKKKGVWDRCGGNSEKVAAYVSNRKLVDILYRDKASIAAANKQMSKVSEAASADRGKSIYDQMTESVSVASGENLPYVVLQVTLKEKLLGTGSRNLGELERVINGQVAKGYRLHTISTAAANSTGLAGGDRIQATLVFEKLGLR